MTAATIDTDSLVDVTVQASRDSEAEWRPTVPGNAGHPLAEAPLPYWLDRPCPAWCVLTTPHQDHDDYDDRLHHAASYGLT
jgi:hypothetical protein